MNELAIVMGSRLNAHISGLNIQIYPMQIDA